MIPNLSRASNIFLAITLAATCWAQPTVSNVRADYVPAPNAAAPHSYFRLRWNTSVSSICYHRIKYGQTSSYGNVITAYGGNDGCPQYDIGATVSGLAPSTTYHYCVQSSSDGVTFGACSTDATYTTAALPAVHPAPPQFPTLYNPAYPNTSGYNTATVGANCTSPTLQSLVNTAVTNQTSNGTVITIPHGTICPQIAFPDDTQSATVTQNSSNISTSTGTFSNVVFPSGWTPALNDAVVFSGASAPPDAATNGNGDNHFNSSTGAHNGSNGQLTPGYTYYLKNVSGSGPYSFQLSATAGGSAIVPGDVGSGTFTMQKATPLNSNWIIITTDTADSAFCPQGVRCMGSVWQPKMGTIRVTGGVITGTATTGLFSHHIWYRGIEMTWTDASSLANSTVDPVASNNLFYVPETHGANHIVLDRCYMHGLAFPNRYQSAILGFGGQYMAIINSDIEGIDYWNPNVTPEVNQAYPTATNRGFYGVVSGQTLTLSPGVAYLGPINTCTASGNITFTITGGSSSTTAYVYLTSACVPTILLPTGMTATCTGSATDSSSVSHNCNVPSTVTTPSWPLDGSGGINALTIGELPLSSGTAGSFANLASLPLSQWTNGGSGPAMIQFGCGTGPYSFLNNYMEGTGIGPFSEDGCIVDPSGNWWHQNSFNWLQQFKSGWSGSNNYQYLGRNGWELKHGRSLLIDGNTCTGIWASISATGQCYLLHSGDNNGTLGTVGGTGYPGYTVQDIQFTNNTCTNMESCLTIGDNSISFINPIAAVARSLVSNNLFVSNNGFTQNDGNTGNAPNGGSNGVCFYLGGQLEDFVFDHNTCYDNRGVNPQLFHWIGAIASEGMKITNNLLFANSSAVFLSYETANVVQTAPALTGSIYGAALWALVATSDPNVPAGIMQGNVIAPYYSTFGGYPNYSPSGLVDKTTLCNSFLGGTYTAPTPPSLVSCPGGIVTTVLSGASAAINLSTMAFTQSPSNLKLLYSSPFVSGATVKYSTDGTDVGANVNALLTAQGAVNPPTVLSITATSATISWYAYDGTIGCAVDVAAAPSDPSAQTIPRVTASAANSQSVNLTGLSANTTYNVRVMCPVIQNTVSFTTP